MNIKLADAQWLVSEAKKELVGIDVQEDILKLATRLRKRLTQTQTRLLCELLELRRRGRPKFSKSDEMFFIRSRLEQATDERIADYKAIRFEGQPRIVDLCCGIGGDAIALARMGELTIVDLSAAIVHLAQANLSVLEQNAAPITDDARTVPLADYSAWHIDPDRRVEKRRSDPEWCEPSLSEILDFQKYCSNGAVKLAPGASVTRLLERGVELEWIGHGGECQQLVAWFGELANHPGKKTATWLHSGGASSLVELPAGGCRSTSRPSTFVFEPRPSVLAAGLEESAAVSYGLSRLGQTAYFTGDAEVDSPMMSAFQVLEDIAFHRDALNKQIRRHGLCVTEVKKRGVSIDPNALLSELKTTGKPSDLSDATLLLYSIASSIRVTIARRL